MTFEQVCLLIGLMIAASTLTLKVVEVARRR